MRFFYFLFVVLMLQACSEEAIENEPIQGVDTPVTETSDNYEVTYKYKSGVLIYTAKDYQFIQRVVEDSIIYIDGDAPKEMIPAVGEYLSSRICDKLPYGLGNKVIEVTNTDDSYKIITTSSSLDEIFEELKIKANIQLLDTINRELVDTEGNRYETSYADNTESRFAIGSPKILTINLGNYTNNTGAGLYATGSLSVGAILVIDMDLASNTSEFSLEFGGGLDGSVGARGSVKGDFMKTIPNIVNGIVAIGPVVLRPYINLKLGVEGSIEGTASVGFSKYYGCKVGFVNGKFIAKNTSTSTSTLEREGGFLNKIEYNGTGTAAFVAALECGAGLYTKNIAMQIDPSVSIGFSASMNQDNLNLFRESPTLDFGISLSADAVFYIDFMGKDLWHNQQTLVNFNIFSGSMPLLPSLVDESLKIEKDDESSELLFNATYSVNDGLLCKFMNIIPTFKVSKGDNQIYVLRADRPIVWGEQAQKFEFELKELEYDTHYTGNPGIELLGLLYDEDGKPFSSATPTAAITDIVQTGSEAGAFTFNGKNYTYKFHYYVNAEIVGSENCTEWGLYAPQSSTKKYVANELKDGRQTQHWTGYSNQTSASFSKTPYAIVKGETNYRYYESRNATFSYGSTGSRSVPTSSIHNDNDFVLVLDSIVYHP